MPHTAHDGSVLLQAIVQSPHGMINGKDRLISSESLLSRSSDGTRRSGWHEHSVAACEVQVSRSSRRERDTQRPRVPPSAMRKLTLFNSD